MKKYYYLALAAISIYCIALTGCEKNNEPAEPASAADAPVFSATIESSDAAANAGIRKTQIADGSTADKKKVEWLNTDKVFIFSIKNNYEPVVIGEYTAAPNSTDATRATLNPGSDLIDSRGGTPILTFAFYPAPISWLDANRSTVESYIANNRFTDLAATLAPKIVLPAQQTYSGNDLSLVAPMAARCESGTLGFCNLTALLAINVPSTMFSSVRTISVSADKQLWGDFSLNETSGSGWNQLMPKSTADANKTVTLICNALGTNTTIPEGGETFYVSIPPATYSRFRITVTDGTTTRSISTQAESIPLERNRVYSIDFTQEKTTLLPGKYSVSGTKQVHFTRGNLYWNGSEYRLEEKQSDCPTTWNTNHVGHFYWNTPADVTASRHPYAEQWTYGTLSDTDQFFCGEDNKMTVEGTKDLYVLSQAEWNYLISSRSQANRFAKARVNGMAGHLLFPDGYTAPLPTTGMAEVNNTGTVQNPLEYPTDGIPAEIWSAMEAQGVVFLPAAGYRTNTAITLYPELEPNDKTGIYWSSTPYSGQVSISYAVYFSTKNILLQINPRGWGNPIRLVK